MPIADDGLPVCQVPSASSARLVRAAVLAGYAGDEEAARAALLSSEAAVRAAGLSALARMGSLGADELARSFQDVAPQVRRRACELSGRLGRVVPWPAVVAALIAALDDSSPAVVEAACSALGELVEGLSGSLAEGSVRAIGEALARTATSHQGPLCREAAVGALGCLADAGVGGEIALAAITAALGDKPAVRRRAVGALGCFELGITYQALQQASRDRDWQVRELAQELLGAPQGTSAHEQVSN